MLVKKIPIFQGFPDLCTVKLLSKSKSELSEFRPIFFDIETTGLSRYTTFVYLIGAVKWESDQWVLYQWMAEKSEEESLVLKSFSEFLKDCSCTIQYNGNRFDQPYLEERYKRHDMESPFQEIPSCDLYQLLKPCQGFFKLIHMKQPDLENFMNSGVRMYCDGGQCIRIYKSYLKKRDIFAAETVLGHNQEDLLGLGKIFTLLSYLCLYEGQYQAVKAELTEQELILHLKLPAKVPQTVSNGTDTFYFTVSGEEARLLVHLKEGRLKQYYSNYKDYEYIPEEDTAITKSLSKYMDKSLRVPARPDTCYTWFYCDERFLADPKRQMQYLKHTLTYYLNSLNANMKKTPVVK